MARKNNQINARFVSGSTMQHILVMTSTSTLGLMAVFLVDLTDMYFLSLLGEQAIAAAIGFAGSIAFITRMISGFGDSYIAAFAVIGRVIPVAFAMVFALSGAIGSIIGQNYGAGFFDRVKQVQNNALLFAAAYTMLACLIVWLSTPWISCLFNLQREATALFVFYWTFISWTYLFLGAQYIANASFNNLGKPFWSTVSNWGRILLGTIPLAWLGAKLLGVYGVLIGEAIGTMLLGSISIWVSRRLINNLHSDMDIGEAGRTTVINPLSSGIAATGVVSSQVTPRNIDKQNHPSQN